MAELPVDIPVRLQGARKVSQGLDSMGRSAGKADKAVDDMGRSADKAEKAVGKQGKGLTGALGWSSEGMKKAALGAGKFLTAAAAAAAATTAFTAAMRLAAREFQEQLRIFGEFETALLQSHTLAGVQLGALEEIAPRLRQIGVDTGITFDRIAAGHLAAASGGLDLARSQDLVASSARLSALGLGEVDIVARSLTPIMRTFNLEAESSAEFLLATAEAGQVAADTIAPAMGRLLGSADSLNIRIEDLGAAFATYTQTGQSASETSTVLNAIFTSMLNPSQEALKIANDLNFSFDRMREIAGSQGLGPALEYLRDATAGNDQQMARLLGSTEALRGVFVLAGKDAEFYADTIDEITNRKGKLQERFEAVQETVQNATDQMSRAFDDLRASAAAEYAPDLVELLKFITEFVKDDDVKKLAKDIGEVLHASFTVLNVAVKNFEHFITGLDVLLPIDEFEEFAEKTFRVAEGFNTIIETIRGLKSGELSILQAIFKIGELGGISPRDVLPRSIVNPSDQVPVDLQDAAYREFIDSIDREAAERVRKLNELIGRLRDKVYEAGEASRAFAEEWREPIEIFDREGLDSLKLGLEYLEKLEKNYDNELQRQLEENRTDGLEKGINESQALVDAFAESVQSTLSDAFSDVLSGELESFEDFFDSIFDLFTDLIADMIAKAAAEKIFSSVFGGGEGEDGAGGPGFGSSFGADASRGSRAFAYAGVGAFAGGFADQHAGPGARSQELATLGGGIGGAVSPLGGAIGVVAGTILGRLFEKALPEAIIDIESQDGVAVANALRNRGVSQALTNQISKSIEDTVDAIISGLGAELGETQGSLGLRINESGEFSVLVNGIARDFGENAEAATEFAIVEMIRRADISGVSQAISATLSNTTAETVAQLEADLAVAREIEASAFGEGTVAVTEFFASLKQLITQATELGIDSTTVLEAQVSQIEEARGRITGRQSNTQIIDELNAAYRFNEELLQTQLDAQERQDEILREIQDRENASTGGEGLDQDLGEFLAGQGGEQFEVAQRIRDAGLSVEELLAEFATLGELLEGLPDLFIDIDQLLEDLSANFTSVLDGGVSLSIDEITNAAESLRRGVERLGEDSETAAELLEEIRLAEALQLDLLENDVLARLASTLGAIPAQAAAAAALAAQVDQARYGIEVELLARQLEALGLLDEYIDSINAAREFGEDSSNFEGAGPEQFLQDFIDILDGGVGTSVKNIKDEADELREILEGSGLGADELAAALEQVAQAEAMRLQQLEADVLGRFGDVLSRIPAAAEDAAEIQAKADQLRFQIEVKQLRLQIDALGLMTDAYSDLLDLADKFGEDLKNFEGSAGRVGRALRADTVGQYLEQLFDPVRDLLQDVIGEGSTPRENFAAVYREFEATRLRAEAGDAAAIRQYPEIARDLLRLAEQNPSAGLFQDIAARIREDSMGLLAIEEQFRRGETQLLLDVGNGILAGIHDIARILRRNSRAVGGSVNLGSSYLVGEQGPEIFVPRTSGEILPNGQMLQSGVGSSGEIRESIRDLTRVLARESAESRREQSSDSDEMIEETRLLNSNIERLLSAIENQPSQEVS